jgi:hypothetical protein
VTLDVAGIKDQLALAKAGAWIAGDQGPDVAQRYFVHDSDGNVIVEIIKGDQYTAEFIASAPRYLQELLSYVEKLEAALQRTVFSTYPFPPTDEEVAKVLLQARKEVDKLLEDWRRRVPGYDD